MEKLCLILKLSTAYIVTSVLLVCAYVALKYFGITTLGTLGIIALILTISPGFTIIRKHVKPIELKNQSIDFWFLSGVAVALVGLPLSIFDEQSKINDRCGYGIVGFIMIILIIISVYKNRK